MTKENIGKKLIELRNFFTSEFTYRQDFVVFRPNEKGAVLNLEKILYKKYDISGKGTVVAIACSLLLENLEKEEKDKTQSNGQ
jgi:hypothetical protein